MDTKFTKGEWYKMNAKQMGVPFIIASGNETLFQVYGEDAEHNANLALAAPAMFEMLNKINKQKMFHQGNFDEIKQLLTQITQ